MDSSIRLSSTTKTTHELRAHQGPVASIRGSASNHLISAGWDGLVAYWTISPSHVVDSALTDRANENDAARAKKRKRKVESDVTVLKPAHRLEGHTGTVSRAVVDRTDASKAYSAGCDHTLREWNLEHGVEVASRVRGIVGGFVACSFTFS
jgi:ribosome biogenesis protein YTM1